MQESAIDRRVVGINVKFDQLLEANHFFARSEEMLKKSLNKYISKESALF